MTVNSGYDRRGPALRGMKVPRGRADSGFSCTMPGAAERQATARQAEKGKARVRYHQRCAVRMTYLKNKIRGQWKAHGRYLTRESAAVKSDATQLGFNRETEGVDIAGQLQSWQTAGDQQFWKLIVSPEFGDRVDLSRLTRSDHADGERSGNETRMGCG
jgi:hypothetical protein